MELCKLADINSLPEMHGGGMPKVERGFVLGLYLLVLVDFQIQINRDYIVHGSLCCTTEKRG
jgi:hypothetical protein